VLVISALRTELLFVSHRPRAALGCGAQSARRLPDLLRRVSPSSVLVVGYCGGLRASLACGELLLADEVEAPRKTTPSLELLEIARRALPSAHVGPLVTQAQAADPAEKARLGVRALGVDMETAYLARLMDDHGIPWLALRIVLDRLWEQLPLRWAAARWAARAVRCARILGGATNRLVAALEAGP